jgi:hypothetical protein
MKRKTKKLIVDLRLCCFPPQPVFSFFSVSPPRLADDAPLSPFPSLETLHPNHTPGRTLAAHLVTPHLSLVTEQREQPWNLLNTRTEPYQLVRVLMEITRVPDKARRTTARICSLCNQRKASLKRPKTLEQVLGLEFSY